MKARVTYRIDNTTIVDTFNGRHISSQMFRGGKAIIRCDRRAVQYRKVERIEITGLSKSKPAKR